MKRALKAKKKIVARKSRTELYLVNLKYMGEELKFKHKQLTDGEISKAFNWYNTMCDVSDAREYTVTFLTNNKLLNVAKESKIISDAFFPKTSAWVFRLVNNGYIIDNDMIKRSVQRILDEIQKTKSRKDEFKDKEKFEEPKVTTKHTSNLIADIEDILDAQTRDPKYVANLYNSMTVKKVSMADAKEALQYYSEILAEQIDASKPKADPQLYEGYIKRPGKTSYVDRIKFIDGLVNDLERYTNNKKAVRKPRVAKPISLDKKLKNFKYLDQSAELKVVSQHPSKVIGSSEVFVYNTKTKVVSHYIAKDGQKLDITANKFINWDEEKSSTKRVGKKADTLLQELVKSAKNMVIKKYNELNTLKTKATGRSSETLLIVRVL